MSNRAIDVSASRVILRTRATGLLARFAHDLEIVAEGFEGTVEVDGDRWSTELTFPVRRLRVIGSLKKNGKIDFGAISTSDLAEIERKIRDECLRGSNVRVTAEGTSPSRAQLQVIAPEGRQHVSCPLRVSERAKGGHQVTGEVRLSLSALGVPEIKGPLKAFKVFDEVEVEVDFVVKEDAG